MRICNFLLYGVLAAGLVLCSFSANAVWQMKTVTDNLDSTKQSVTLYSEAQSFQQNGSSVRVFLTVYCEKPSFLTPKKPLEMHSALQFSSKIAIGERQFRWRVDDRTVWSSTHLIDGDFLLLDKNTFKEIRGGKRLRVEADLPWAGVILLDFDLTDATEAFAKLPCAKGK